MGRVYGPDSLRLLIEKLERGIARAKGEEAPLTFRPLGEETKQSKESKAILGSRKKNKKAKKDKQ
jgi:hypothetical protein